MSCIDRIPEVVSISIKPPNAAQVYVVFDKILLADAGPCIDLVFSPLFFILRERNREHSKKSRVRKKFLLESLERSVSALEAENENLREAIHDHLGKEGDQVLTEVRVPSSYSPLFFVL